ncbi:hypothetical protein A6S26_05370 [Nostoc sp. ATCC 43529]|nr:hypothetical protein A6S26_05370 [Nostoc sp. ATCC 43529]
MPHFGLYLFAQILPFVQWAGKLAVVSPICLVFFNDQFLAIAPQRSILLGNQRLFALVVAIGEGLGGLIPEGYQFFLAVISFLAGIDVAHFFFWGGG